MDGNGHGTHCAGTIGAVHNNIGVPGVMANVSLVPVKFLTDEGSGSTEGAIKAIEYAIKVGVNVMSNSWGGGGYSEALKDVIEKAKNAGIVFVAAAGNSSTNNDTSPHYPSSYDVDNVIAVASIDSDGGISDFSCYGKQSVDVAAPGRDIYSTWPGGGYKSISGTSMATPHVSGVMGLYLSMYNFDSFVELKKKLMETAVYSSAYKNKILSQGRVDAFNFLTNTKPARPVSPPESNSYNFV